MCERNRGRKNERDIVCVSEIAVACVSRRIVCDNVTVRERERERVRERFATDAQTLLSAKTSLFGARFGKMSCFTEAKNIFYLNRTGQANQLLRSRLTH